ncbi:hypothetical protein CDD83_1862 [Cordyceps sp. RAO-2017]|nr:hypothetical protein CDD83_1862 [Cordyceps sp. RAO-2017]
MRRVARAGGIVAARESDYGAFAWYPDVDGMDGWKALYRSVAVAKGGQPDAGRMVHAWARAAGFAPAAVACSSSTWCYSTADEIAWWSGLWAERTVSSAFAQSALGAGLATEAELDETAAAWIRWGRQEDAWFSLLHGEVICRKEA